MARTYKDSMRNERSFKFPRVPPITKRCEPFKDKRRKVRNKKVTPPTDCE